MDIRTEAIEEEIWKVEGDIQAATDELAKSTDEADKAHWREEKKQLCKKEEQLRKEEEQLRRKEEQLREEKLIALRGGADHSSFFAKQLIQPQLDAPPVLNDLLSFLSTPPAAKIPVTEHALSYARLTPKLAQHFTAASGNLANTVGCSLTAPLIIGDSKLWTVCTENTVFVSLILGLDAAVPVDMNLGLSAERDQRDSTSLMTVKSAGGPSLRPDGVLRDRSGLRMLAKWEDKGAGCLHLAIEALRKKTAIWTPLYYGDIEYLPCFAAAGSELQFFAISRTGGMEQMPHPVSNKFNLTDPDDRAQAVMATIKFYQLLRAQHERYPRHVLPANRELWAGHPGGLFQRALLFRSDQPAIRKRLSPWSAYAKWCGVDFKSLTKLYDATAWQQGVVHAMQAPSLLDDHCSVDLVPLGLSPDNALPKTEDDVRQMVHCLLHGLAAIHEAFVHRDLRWDNIMWSPPGRRWFLIDLETCAPANQRPVAGFQPVGWQLGVTLVDGRYTCASDLYQLGQLVQQECRSVRLSPAGQAFMRALLTPPAAQHYSAKELLSLEWLQCGGRNCRTAGAQPHEC